MNKLNLQIGDIVTASEGHNADRIFYTVKKLGEDTCDVEVNDEDKFYYKDIPYSDLKLVSHSKKEEISFNQWFISLPEERQKVLCEDKWMLAEAAYNAGKV